MKREKMLMYPDEYRVMFEVEDAYWWYRGVRELLKRWLERYAPANRSHAMILDVGCGKAFLLYELKQLLPDAEVVGFDISEHGIADAKEEIRDNLFLYRAQDPYPFGDKEFDLVISLGCCHNLRLFELKTALGEIERVAKDKYFMVESYRNERELFNLECWALTCESFFDTAEWIWLLNHFGYTGDYEFIYFE